jgi:hypothetical protein
MTIDFDRVAAISRDVASEFDGRLSVVSALATEGGGARAEVLVVVDGCHDEPCRHVVNVSRATPSDFEHEFRAKLLDALNSHRGE